MYELRKSRPVVFGICANAGISEPCTITSLARSRNPPHRRGGPNSRQPAMHSRTLQHKLQLGDVRRVAWLSLITRAPLFVRDPDCPASAASSTEKTSPGKPTPPRLRLQCC
jgi:hypothetical protein